MDERKHDKSVTDHTYVAGVSSSGGGGELIQITGQIVVLVSQIIAEVQQWYGGQARRHEHLVGSVGVGPRRFAMGNDHWAGARGAAPGVQDVGAASIDGSLDGGSGRIREVGDQRDSQAVGQTAVLGQGETAAAGIGFAFVVSSIEVDHGLGTDGVVSWGAATGQCCDIASRQPKC